MITTGCASGQMYGGASVSIMAQIPLAPNVVLTVESPIIASPDPSYIWIDGYWTWDPRMRGYVWVQGFWALAPFPGAIWTPGFWQSYRGGYRWIDARWWPGDSFMFGFQNNRFDYYGRPVFFPRPRTAYDRGYVINYDNRPETRGKGYSSSPVFNNAPSNERSRMTKDFQRTTSSSTRPSGTARNRQEVIPIRENGNQQVTRESSAPTTRQSNPQDNRTPSATPPSRTQQQDNSRQNTESYSNPSRSTESRSSSTYENSRGRDSNSTPSQSRNSNSNSGTSRSSRSR